MMSTSGHNGNTLNSKGPQNPSYMSNNQARPPTLNKPDPKKQVGRKPTPNGDKKSGQPKSPAVKKTREVTLVKLFVVQQQYRANEFKLTDDDNKDGDNIKVPEIELDEEDEKPVDQAEDQQEPAAQEEPAQEEEQQPEDPVEEDERVAEEDHEAYEESNEGSNEESVELYDQNCTREIQVNSKNKATCLKKIILESIDLYKRANIVLLKHVKVDNPETGRAELKWEPFSENDYNEQCKTFAN